MSDENDVPWDVHYFDFFDDPLPVQRATRVEVAPPLSTVRITRLMADNYSDNHLTYISRLNFAISGRPLLIALHAFEENALELKPWLDLLHKVAEKYHDKIGFIIGDDHHISLVDPLFVFCTTYFNKTEPPYIYAVDAKGHKFKHNGLVTIESMMEYCQNLLDGKLYISEPLPLNRRDSILKICVADNFNQLIEENYNDVLLVFYTDWCIYSQELMPVLDELSEILKDERICIAKFNAEKNYIPLEYNIFCYPIIYLIRSDDKRTTIDYQIGPRTLENVLKFIAANSLGELINYDRSGKYKY